MNSDSNEAKKALSLADAQRLVDEAEKLEERLYSERNLTNGLTGNRGATERTVIHSIGHAVIRLQRLSSMIEEHRVALGGYHLEESNNAAYEARLIELASILNLKI